MTLESLHRRRFLQRSAALSVAGAGLPLALNLAHMADAAAQTASGADYKAIVCVFLQGGNDQGNTLIPFDLPGYQTYARTRGSVALSRDSLTATALSPSVAGGQLALAPSLAPLKPLFDAGQLAALLNIGPLVQPTTRQEYIDKSKPLPAKLFSHNDQQSMWQSYGTEGTATGWGGQMGDVALSGNGTASLTCINTAGNAVYLSGDDAVPYMVNPSEVPTLGPLNTPLFGSAGASQAFRQLVTQTRQQHVLAADHATIMARAIDVNQRLRSALATAPALTGLFDEANALAVQLRMVARLISVQSTLGLKRQVFFVSLPGFDLHDNLLSQHPVLLGKLASALVGFQAALGQMGMARQVTTFTASDFGRTLSGNGDGSDHGWGSHHLVMGASVQGGRFYGQWPGTALGGPQDVGQGRLLPTMGVQQLALALARWMGVPQDQFDAIAPGWTAFDASTLSGLLSA